MTLLVPLTRLRGHLPPRIIASWALSLLLVGSLAVHAVGRGGAIAASANTTDPFANLRSPGALLLTAVLLVVVLGASYVGARRGEALHAHNQAVIHRQRSRKARERLSDTDS